MKQGNTSSNSLRLVNGPSVVKIKFEDIPNVIFTSDFHLNHENIIRFTNRPYANASDMNKSLMDNLTKSVLSIGKNKAIVFNCGDLMYGTKREYREFTENLTYGKYYMCIGNHDLQNVLKQCQFDTERNDAPIVWNGEYIVEVLDENGRRLTLFTVSHHPQITFTGDFNLHGHLHTVPNLDDYIGKDKEIAKQMRADGKHYDVGVDNNGMKPVRLIDILLGNVASNKMDLDYEAMKEKLGKLINRKNTVMLSDEELVTKKVIPCLNEMYKAAKSPFKFRTNFEMFGKYAPVIDGEKRSVSDCFYLPKEKYDSILEKYCKGFESRWYYPYAKVEYPKGEEFERLKSSYEDNPDDDELRKEYENVLNEMENDRKWEEYNSKLKALWESYDNHETTIGECREKEDELSMEYGCVKRSVEKDKVAFNVEQYAPNRDETFYNLFKLYYNSSPVKDSVAEKASSKHRQAMEAAKIGKAFSDNVFSARIK